MSASSHDLYRIDLYSPVGRAEVREILIQLGVRPVVVEWMVDTIANLATHISCQEDDMKGLFESQDELHDRIYDLEEQIKRAQKQIKTVEEELHV